MWKLSSPTLSLAPRAVAAGLFKKDKDTGMTDRLKPVYSARKALQNVLDKDPPATDDKKKAAMEEVLAAYAKFRTFADGKLRVLSTNPAWGKYCDSAVQLVDKEIKDGKKLLTTLD